MKNNNHINCQECGINELCLPAMLAETEVSQLDAIIQRSSLPIKKGVHLFNTGDPFEYIYAIKAGAFKSYVNSYSGEEQIFAFHLSSELIGLDAIYSDFHCSSAVALVESQICKIPFESVNEISEEIGGLKNQVMRLLSKEIAEDQELMLMLGQKKAKAKLSALLINLSSRYKARNLSHEHYNLPMSRSDLANFLGMTVETVSRIFNELKKFDIIDIKGKQIHLKDINALKHLAGIFFK